MLCLLTALALVAAPPPPIQSADRLEPIGWSADQRAVALRVFFGGSSGEQGPCPGYIDAAGKRFETGLAIVVLRDGAVLRSFVIQASPGNEPCTVPAAAKQALEAAKQQLDELGIDRAAPGAVLDVSFERGKATSRTKDGIVDSKWKETWRARTGTATALELVVNVNDSFDVIVHRFTASFTWRLRSGATERTGTLKLGPIGWSSNMAGAFTWGLPAFASPNGEMIVAFIQQRHSNMRGSSAVTTLLPLDVRK